MQKANDIKVFVSNASSDIKKVLEKVNFIKNIGEDYYKDSKEDIIPLILKHYQIKNS